MSASKKKTQPIEGEVITDPAEQLPANEETAVATTEPVALTPKQTEKKLGIIATAIRKEVGKGNEALFAIGHLLNDARDLLPSDKLFGQWVEAQGFDMSQSTANRLQRAASNEAAVREFIAAQSSATGKSIGPVRAMELMNRSDDDRQPAERVKAVQALLGDEPVNANEKTFAKFKAAYEALDVSQLTEDELVELAGIIKGLYDAYGAEKARR